MCTSMASVYSANYEINNLQTIIKEFNFNTTTSSVTCVCCKNVTGKLWASKFLDFFRHFLEMTYWLQSYVKAKLTFLTQIKTK